MKSLFKIPLVLKQLPEGGYTVTSPMLTEMITEGDTMEQALANVQDALAATIELYEDMEKEFPTNLVKKPA
jgi:antitoxin HicB